MHLSQACPGAQLGEKSHTWQSHNNQQGVIRNFHPLEQIRFSWRLHDSSAPTKVSVDLIPQDANSTRIEITHSQLGDDAKSDWIKDRWTAALDRIESECL